MQRVQQWYPVRLPTEGLSAAEPQWREANGQRHKDAGGGGCGLGDAGGAACPRRSAGLHVIAGEETRFFAHDPLAPTVRVPPRDEEEGARLEGELVVLLPRVGVEGHHCERREERGHGARQGHRRGQATAGKGRRGHEQTAASLAIPALASAGAELGPRCCGCRQGLSQKHPSEEFGGIWGSTVPFSR